ncbi:MAG: hypothetical protein C4334_09635 [Pyrinomonas sp.]
MSKGKKRVFVYLGTMPRNQGSGASLRFYSNIRAYLDLGFEVEAVQIATDADGSEPSPDLHPVTWRRVIEAPPVPSVLGRLMYRAGIPHRTAVEYYFPSHRAVRREVESCCKRDPEAIHHLEGESHANVIPWLPKGARSIWSFHDLPSAVAEATIRVACEVNQRSMSAPERRDLQFARRVERLMARHAPLILCIADYDRDRLRNEWGCDRAEYLPMSIPGDGADRVANNWLRDGRLRLLHVGRISHLPSYRSLEFLLCEIFPRLPAHVLARVSLDIIGRIDRDERAGKILALAERYPNVSFLGFVQDVVPYYNNSDLQIVAATEATGLRTRIIESFAYGLPVLSTSVGARGIAGMRPGEHLLIADDAAQFAEHISILVHSPEILDRLSRRGRDFYLRNQSSSVVASTLAHYLQRYFGIVV